MEQIQVLTDTFASTGEVAALDTALSNLGYEAEIERIVPPQGLSPWLVVIGVPAGQFIAGFFGKAGGCLGSLQAFLRRDSGLPRAQAALLAASLGTSNRGTGDQTHCRAPAGDES